MLLYWILLDKRKGGNMCASNSLTKQDLLIKLSAAVSSFLKGDSELLEINVSERSISSKLACYIDCEFKQDKDFDISVDAEYNRDNLEPKRTTRGAKTTPDILVHRRRESEFNLVYLEMKKDDTDSVENEDYGTVKSQFVALNYCYGIDMYKFNSEYIEMYLFEDSHPDNPEKYCFNKDKGEFIKVES